MSLKIGIIGLPNIGKSTLFNALISQKKAEVSNYPFCTIEPNAGTVMVPDSRLKKLAQVLNIKKVVPATLEFVDIAGLVKGAHQGEGLGNEFLSHIQKVDLLCQVLPYFNLTTPKQNHNHAKNTEQIKKHLQIIKDELLLKDLQWLGQALEKEKDNKKKKLLEKIQQGLNEGKKIIDQDLTTTEKTELKKFNFLTTKKVIYVANLAEKDLGKSLKKGGIPEEYLKIGAKTEEDLTELNNKEATEYYQAFGLSEKALDKLIKKAYQTLGLISFYTLKEDGSQLQAWPIRKNVKARKAAGMIHTDFAKKFIQAQVVTTKSLLKTMSLAKAGEKGLIKARGENYPIKDGEVINFKHN